VLYDDLQMRRVPSVLLILIFWLGPLVAVFQGGDDSRLPACCRRNGAHHCAMDEQTAVTAMLRAQSGPAFSAPSHCPYCPRATARISGPVFALSSAAMSARQARVERFSPAALSAAPLLPSADLQDDRGPPQSILL
jgi:hypothetical protein